MEEFSGVIGIVFQRKNPNRYVLIHNKKSGNITLPAGGREGNESPEQTLQREIKEETGLLQEDYKIIKTPIIHEFVYNSKKKERAGQKSRQLVYFLETTKKDLHPEDSDSEILGWFHERDILQKLTFSDSKELFKRALNYI
jgi:8-oxo-dGTP pyrophosphatase MutT (NUDIX family)